MAATLPPSRPTSPLFPAVPAKPARKTAEEVAAQWLDELNASIPDISKVHPMQHVRENLLTLLKRLEER